MIIVSTFFDAEEVSARNLAELYRARWNAEVDLRPLKQTMQIRRQTSNATPPHGLVSVVAEQSGNVSSSSVRTDLPIAL